MAILSRLYPLIISTQSKQSDSQREAGFTLIEVLLVAIIIGVLAVIAAPSWAGFVNRQRLNQANDEVYRSLQQAQSEAKVNKKSYSVKFKANAGMPQYALYESTTPEPADSALNWQNLTENPNQITLSATQTITYNYLGEISDNITIPTEVVLSLTDNSNIKRCVEVTTLLGALRKEQDNRCASSGGSVGSGGTIGGGDSTDVILD